MRDGKSVIFWSSTAIGIVTIIIQLRRKLKKGNNEIPAVLLVSPYSSQLLLAAKIAQQAGDNMASFMSTMGTTERTSESLQISIKGGKPEDFCTQVDLQNENLCIASIHESFPSDCIIGEEESSASGDIQPLTNDPTWILDPIDGTTNFASGLPLCCVSIGYCVDSHPVMGVVYAPSTNEWYMAVKGHGAYRNGMRIHSQKEQKKLIDSVVGFEFGYARSDDAVEKMVGAVRNIMLNGCRTLRCLGSGVLDLCYVASGRLDILYSGVANEGWKPWDYCAGYVIATESGCTIEAIPSDQVFDLYSESVICGSSKALVDELRIVIRVK